MTIEELVVLNCVRVEENESPSGEEDIEPTVLMSVQVIKTPDNSSDDEERSDEFYVIGDREDIQPESSSEASPETPEDVPGQTTSEDSEEIARIGGRGPTVEIRSGLLNKVVSQTFRLDPLDKLWNLLHLSPDIPAVGYEPPPEDDRAWEGLNARAHSQRDEKFHAIIRVGCLSFGRIYQQVNSSSEDDDLFESWPWN